eukprot:TRINITY_DN4559_c0_g1_i1.p1 TRINITY_DN4559_c0_g1~~TRINITY_DN4559_c0_g1_i1.p1  ORF type:complete len:102 (-),score=11.91 TRINITY_DN4559_c0_g1_i1:141-446(-)
MGGGHEFKIPDWRSYTIGEHTPQLLHTQKMLKSMGLKDPWLRNEVWRYDNRTVQGSGTKLDRIKSLFGFKHFCVGLGLAIVTATIKRVYEAQNPHHHDAHH